MNCRRCGHRFALEEGFAGIHFSQGRTAAEQLANGRALHLCPECADLLRTWLGLAPQYTDAVPRSTSNPNPPPIPQPPVRLCSEP
jgi:hypothetical protein